jgi:hypothetical protein
MWNISGGTGSETFINNNRSMAFGTTVNNTYANAMGLRNRGVKTGNFAVITHTHAKAILVELAFIDSPLTNPDVSILRNKRKEMAEAIAKGIYAHAGITPSKPVEDKPEEVIEVRFNTVEEVPSWATETIQKMITKGLLNGDGNNLNLSEDMIRIFVTNDRAGLYG